MEAGPKCNVDKPDSAAMIITVAASLKRRSLISYSNTETALTH